MTRKISDPTKKTHVKRRHTFPSSKISSRRHETAASPATVRTPVPALVSTALLLAAPLLLCSPRTSTAGSAAKYEYISLRRVARRYGLRLHSIGRRNVELQSKWTTIRFLGDSRRIYFNHTMVWLHAPVVRRVSGWSLATRDADGVLDPLLRRSRHLTGCGYRVVVLDPGHGGRDRGARGRRGVEEKRVVLDIARRTRLILANAGLKVYLTREGDRFIPLSDRCRRAARWKADLFVSIHANASTKPGAHGVETYVLAGAGFPPTNAGRSLRTRSAGYPGNRWDGANTILGYCLQRNLVAQSGGGDRGLRRARFLVLREAPCPAALVECGYLSNRVEESRLNTQTFRSRIALGIAHGILDYVGSVQASLAVRGR